MYLGANGHCLYRLIHLDPQSPGKNNFACEIYSSQVIGQNVKLVVVRPTTGRMGSYFLGSTQFPLNWQNVTFMIIYDLSGIN